MEGKGSTGQRTCMNDSWMWTMKRGLTMVDKMGELGRRGQKGKKIKTTVIE